MSSGTVELVTRETLMPETRFRYPVWVRGDLDGFFGLMVDNLVQVLTIILLCTTVCGIPPELIFTRMLPGVAISLLIGNLFYGIQAHYVARKYRRPDTTALPYGINTPSVFAFALFVMGPVYQASVGDGLPKEAAADLAWKAGLLACLVSGIIEFLGAFFAERLRRITPRAALLGVLAGVGIALIASDFAFRICSWLSSEPPWRGACPPWALSTSGEPTCRPSACATRSSRYAGSNRFFAGTRFSRSSRTQMS